MAKATLVEKQATQKENALRKYLEKLAKHNINIPKPLGMTLPDIPSRLPNCRADALLARQSQAGAGGQRGKW